MRESDNYMARLVSEQDNLKKQADSRCPECGEEKIYVCSECGEIITDSVTLENISLYNFDADEILCPICYEEYRRTHDEWRD